MKRTYPFLLIFCLLTVACNDDEDTTDSPSTASLTLTEALDNYSTLVLANYQDALAGATALQTSTTALVDAPSEATLRAAKAAWLTARESYGQTEAFRFYGGPIDDENGPEGQLNAWPLDESHIDYVVDPSNGDEAVAGTNIINSPDQFPDITPTLIAEQNENGGETNVSAGYHAIEFLLWGQDVSPGPGGGKRPSTDYLTDGTGTGDHQERRSAYLQAAAQLLIADLQSLVDEWEAGGAFRTFFTSAEEQENSLEKVVSALGKLSKGELAGERMFVAWDLRSKEDEHSCFSDNTHRDIVNNALGIQNVYLGTYTRTDGSTVSGTSFYDVLAAEDQVLADEIKEQLAISVAQAEAIQAPFDQEFLEEPGRTRIKTTYESLQKQGDLFAQAAQVLGFTFDPTDI